MTTKSSLGALCAVPLAALLLALVDHSAAEFAWTPNSLQTEPWRWFTAHWVHLGPTHATLNALAWFAVWSYGRSVLTGWQWLRLLVFCSLATSAALQWVMDHSRPYLGFSAVLHGAWAYIALTRLRQLMDPRATAWTGAALLLAKLSWEQLQGASAQWEQTLGASIAVDAHAWGAAAGCLWFAGFWLSTSDREVSDNPPP